MASQIPTFKAYHQEQIMLLPPSLDELVPQGHPVRVVNEVIDKININTLLNAYANKGCSSYHPKMLLKLLIYGYVSNVYSSRKLEASCKENICLLTVVIIQKAASGKDYLYLCLTSIKSTVKFSVMII